MPVNKTTYNEITKRLSCASVSLVAVSKTKPVEDILELYQLGQKDFGENYVQELTAKYEQLPKDIRWHFIGHLQSNKIKYIAPFVHLIHGVDSEKLLAEINKQALKLGRQINCLLQIHIAQEETKFGLDETELQQVIASINQGKYPNVNVCGLMGMASFSSDNDLVRTEFKALKKLFVSQKPNNSIAFTTISMGMSADYETAIEEGSTMVRIGSLLFGSRN